MMNFYVTINSWVLILVVLIGAVAVAYAVWKQNQQKQSLLYLAALFVCISLVVFLSTAAGIYWNNQEYSDFWNLATIVFTFFGALLTAGAAFATVAAIISYFSVNKKLQEAKSSLKKAQSSLDKFKKLDQERRELQQDLETLTPYQAIIQDLQQYNAIIQNLQQYNEIIQNLQQYNAADIDEEVQQKSLQAAREILDNPQADFEARLRARAIVQENEIHQKIKNIVYETAQYVVEKSRETVKLTNSLVSSVNLCIMDKGDPQKLEELNNDFKEERQKLEELYAIKQNSLIEEYHKLVIARQNNLEIWKLFFQAAPDSDNAYIQAENNYAMAIINYGGSLYMYGMCLSQNKKLNKAIQQWQQAGEQYNLALNIQESRSNAYQFLALHFWGLALYEEAKAIDDIEYKKTLFIDAMEKYLDSMKLSPTYKTNGDSLLDLFKEMAKLFFDTEQIQLWEEAASRVAELQSISTAHKESIQDLLNDIANATVIQFPQQERKP